MGGVSWKVRRRSLLVKIDQQQKANKKTAKKGF